MCGKISVLAARGLQTCDAQALTTDYAEGSRTGGSETHRYGPTSFCNLYIQPHVSAHTKTPLSACRRPRLPKLFSPTPPPTPWSLNLNAMTLIHGEVGRIICTFAQHPKGFQCNFSRTPALFFQVSHTRNAWKLQLINVFSVTTVNLVTIVIGVENDSYLLARTSTGCA